MRPMLCTCLLISAMLVSGCWDRTEINDLAFITGSAFDLTKDKKFLLSVQIAVPSSSQGGPEGAGNGTQERFFVLSATGKNTNDAFQKIQQKSSRKLFTAHRSVIFVGEAFGREKGVNDVLDVYAHDPRQRLRTYIMVVKGGTALEILQTHYPFEQVPIEAVKEMEGLRSELAVTLRDFFVEASGEGINPVTGVIEVQHSPGGSNDKNNIFKLAGSALFKDLKVVGFLDGVDTDGFMWATDRMKHGRVSTELPNGAGIVGVMLNHADRKIKAEVIGDRIKVNIRLSGQGSLVENNSALDISRPKNVALVEKCLEKTVQKQVRSTIDKLQRQYKVDSIGFGRDIYQNRPKQWNAVKSQWDPKYQNAEVSIEVKIQLKGSGMAGPPLQLKDKETIH
ncbi:Ger(x)C family spore germination protein [Paenibacillus sacheonensis]|uniref:Ger(X)C family spore germination protein n=1 Tax=Paenibacillus sacheonensis TaxID=742054 RepID=A0A7X4YN45_9BACL|nr:Ger(x)C family spore germination protein [Paenibacillus sacheonensis]MBM7564868.1 spore germination protein KC [Paenibacillus sacheonensis]NBC69416.1 Ger(x)C family spore germination protein [Paenibacillus sacheonensis]